MKFQILSQIHVPFDRLASGGSEEYHIELARRLAARGHEVVSWAPLPQAASRGKFDGVDWRPIEELDASEPGFWILQRDPSVAQRFQGNAARRDQYLAFACHDFDYPVPDWTKLFDAILADSEVHGNFLRSTHKHPLIVATGVGPCLDRVNEVIPLVRDPKRLIWASSYVRGLGALLDMYERALEWVPDLKLDICYGWESIDIAIPTNPQLGRFKDMIEGRFKQLPGITHHGRLGRDVSVWERYTSAGIWCYPTEWPETACQASMLAQAFGAVPICTPTWALAENVRHGIIIHGFPYGDRLTRARFTQEIVGLAMDPERQQTIRAAMVPDAQERFKFDHVVDRVERFALERFGKPTVYNLAPEQTGVGA